MKKLNRFRDKLSDILICVIVLVLVIANVCLSIYSQSGYMYEGEYIYSGSYSDGYKKIYKLNAEYDYKQNIMIMRLDEINNYPFEMNDAEVMNNSYKVSEDLMVKFDEMDKMITSNYTDDPIGLNEDYLLYGSLSMISTDVALYEKYISFGDDGAILCTRDYVFSVDSTGSMYHMHKNGFLTKLSVQVLRIILTIITVVILGLYLLIRIRKGKIFISKITVGVCLIMFVAVLAVTDYSMNGSYISTETDEESESTYLTINPLNDGQYLVCTSTDGNVGLRHIFEKKNGKLINTKDNNIFISSSVNGVKFCDGNSEIVYHGGDEEVINKWIPVLLFIPLVISVILLVYKIINESMLEEMESIPFGQYTFQDIVYINESMADMEPYYRDNMIGEEFIFLKTLCVTPSGSIEEPLYKLERKLGNLYPLQGKRKMNKVAVFGEDITGTNYFVAYNKKQCLFVQLLEGMITIVYKLGEKQ